MGVLFSGCSPAASTVKCGPGTENVNGLCVVACAEGERREGGGCVPTCGEGESYVDGACRSGGAVFMKRFGELTDELCACNGDEACGEAVLHKAESLKKEPPNLTENERYMVVGLKGRIDECMPLGQVVREFAVIKDEMCACSDKDCAEGVNKKFEDWLKANEKAKGSRSQQDKARAIAEDYTRCMMSAMAPKGDE